MRPALYFSLFVPLLVATVSSLSRERPGEEVSELRGKWKVVLVEFSGRRVSELKGAVLIFSAGGKKSFLLPGGVKERGTYKVDASRTPAEMDATTDGKPGIVKGIYAIEEGRLKICLAQGGGARPREFATRVDTELLLLVLERHREQEEPPRPVPRKSERPAGKRRFRLGFTGFPHDISLEAVTEARKFVRENADIVAHHIEGVPWAECLSGLELPEKLLEEWRGKRDATPEGGKVYLAVSPGRGELKVCDKGLPLPRELKDKLYDHPLVKRAYLEYCRRAVAFFRPDYLVIGIEVNEILDAGVDRWRTYLLLHEYVYGELKRDHDKLPVFASFTLHGMLNKREIERKDALRAYRQILPHCDIIGVSFYPFIAGGTTDIAEAFKWLTDSFDRTGKPYAMVETGEAAQELTFPSTGQVIHGTEDKQAAYYEQLLTFAQSRRFEFVISFVHRDYDALWDKIKGHAPEVFMAWRDCGLVDEAGRKRRAYAIWKRHFDFPLQRN